MAGRCHEIVVDLHVAEDFRFGRHMFDRRKAHADAVLPVNINVRHDN